VGCGKGRYTVLLARTGFDVYAFDWSEKSIAETRKKLTKRKLEANLLMWDMTIVPFPFPTHFFCGVLAVRVIQHAFNAQIPGIASELQRVTAKGGFIYLEVPTSLTLASFLSRYGHQTQIQQIAIEIEPSTWIPKLGPQAGVPHHVFQDEEVRRLFPHCAVEWISNIETRYHVLLRKS
jgi:SAM-dependent methyltransferase